MVAKATDDIDFIEDEIHKEQKQAYTRKVEGKKIRVRGTVEIAKDDYKKAKRLHRKAIWTAWRLYRNTRKQHKILKRQAKNMYKLAKLSEKVGR